MRKRQPEGTRTAGIVIVAVCLLFVIIVVSFLAVRQSQTHDTVTIQPSLPPSETPDSTEQTALFVQVDVDNVRNAIATLSRPAYYHETLEITRYWGDQQAREQVDRWVSNAVTALTVQSEAGTRHYLSDGQTLYYWRDDGQDGIAQISLSAVSLDDLAGVPEYESVLASDRALSDADYVELNNTAKCLFLEYAPDEDGYYDQLWVDCETGLLYKANACHDDELIYQAQQTALEIYAAGDAALNGVFQLPDGYVPFTTE